MDRSLRNALRNAVEGCRRLLEPAISELLQGQFGIHADGRTENPAHLSHLSVDDLEFRERLIERLDHIRRKGTATAAGAVEQLIREAAFTHLNRLVAFKMLEQRKLTRVTVSRGLQSNEFLHYLAGHPDHERLYNTGKQDVAYRHFLTSLGGSVAGEVATLFAADDPAERLFPPQRVLDEVLALLNAEELKDVWEEDETLGWVYQYFTPKQLREDARRKSQAPRNSYELAFRNQFYTPRYVVEFLVDNTLGRIWYEMRKGRTALAERCRYLVRRPAEVFLGSGERAPAEEPVPDDLSVEERLGHPVHIAHRAKKDPREWKVLDPACGSGHFLLYAFELLEAIYDEAYDDPDLGPALRRDYATAAELRRAVPDLILRHNLHGIDIDLRAVQIAGLTLWLRAQRFFQGLGLKRDDRPPIRRVNVVVAEPLPGEEDLLEEFIAGLQPKVLANLVRAVFDEMKLAGEAGSLLKIEAFLADRVAAAKGRWLAEFERARDKKGQELLFSRAEMDRQARGPAQRNLFDVSDVTTEQFWQIAEERVLEELDRYAREAAASQRYRRRLFADDVAHGFAFVDVCRQRYDVVLMNPPFGEASKPSKAYIEENYPRTKHDMYAAFVERGLQWLVPRGMLGAITSRTGFYLASFQRWREELLLREARPTVFADLGQGILDTAMVETAAYCLVNDCAFSGQTTFLRLLQQSDKANALLRSIDLYRVGYPSDLVYDLSVKSFQQVPKSPFIYWVRERIRRLFQQLPPLQTQARRLRLGDHPSDDFRYLRLFWESPASPGDREWIPYYKGADNFPYYDETRLVVDWDSTRQTYRGFFGRPGRSSERPSNYQYFLLPGLTFPYLPHRRGHFSHVPPGAIFGHASPMLQLPRPQHWTTCGILNSNAFVGLLHLLMPRGVHGGQTLKYEVGYVASVPVPAIDNEAANTIQEKAEDCYRLARSTFTTKETSHAFHLPAIMRANGDTLAARIMNWQSSVSENEKRLTSHQRAVDDIVFRLYGIEEEDRRTIEESLGQPADFDEDTQEAVGGEGDEEEAPASQNPSGLAAELLSYCFGCVFGRWDIRFATGAKQPPPPPDPFVPLPTCPPGMLVGSDGLPLREAPPNYPLAVAWSGLLADEEAHPDDIVRRVRDVLHLIWDGRAGDIEAEACQILGVRDLRDYFRKPGANGFWADHLRRYSKSRRKAPIYWLLQSGKKNYAIWLYYHRLDKNLLHKALLHHVQPRLRLESGKLDTLRAQRAGAGDAGRAARQLEREFERQETLLAELHDFHDALRRVADLALEPDLNDGVILNIAPLWELVPWRDAKAFWDDLLAGEYEWSSIGKQLRAKGLVK
jgi:hypothetical protein